MSKIRIGPKIPKEQEVNISIKITETVAQLLEVLSHHCDDLFPDDGRKTRNQRLAEVLYKLIDHAQQGVYRPGAWERAWVSHAFGSDWQNLLEAGDPFGRPACDGIFQRPKRNQ